jgi:hypothetical protein
LENWYTFWSTKIFQYNIHYDKNDLTISAQYDIVGERYFTLKIYSYKDIAIDLLINIIKNIDFEKNIKDLKGFDIFISLNFKKTWISIMKLIPDAKIKEGLSTKIIEIFP